MNYTEAVAAALKGCVELPEEELFALLETPKNPSMGDIAFPCFKLSKLLRKAPNAIAAELKEKIVLPAGIERAEAVGPYLNFFIEKGQQAQTVLTKVLDAGKAYGGSDEGKGRHVVLDYSSINIAKPFGFHHLPSTAIGNALYRIYRHLGYDPVGVNHLGDWGTQFGKMIVAYKRWGEKPVDQYGIRELVDLYVRYHKEAEEHPEMDEEARAWFHRIETGDEEAVALWKQMKDATIREVKKTYARMGVQFDSWAGESFYEDKMEPVIRELKEKGISKLDKGATIVDLSEWNMPPCIILKSDGSTIYATRDLAAACYRKETYDFAKLLYVVAYQQDLHFKQIFKVLELMGRDWVKDCVHVNFGMVSMEGGAFHTREGKVLYLDDVLDAGDLGGPLQLPDQGHGLQLRQGPELRRGDGPLRPVHPRPVLLRAPQGRRLRSGGAGRLRPLRPLFPGAFEGHRRLPRRREGRGRKVRALSGGPGGHGRLHRHEQVLL